MKQIAVSVGTALFLIGSAAQAMESPQTRESLAADIRLAAETHEQKCNRWAALEGEKPDSGGDD